MMSDFLFLLILLLFLLVALEQITGSRSAPHFTLRRVSVRDVALVQHTVVDFSPLFFPRTISTPHFDRFLFSKLDFYDRVVPLEGCI